MGEEVPQKESELQAPYTTQCGILAREKLEMSFSPELTYL